MTDHTHAGEPRAALEFVELNAVPTVVVRVRDYPMARMADLFDATFGALFPALAGQGIAPVGPPFSLHTRMPTDTCDMEVGVPVNSPLPSPVTVGDATFINAELPAGPAATVSHLGSYDGLSDAWGQFMAALVDAGRQPAFPFWEVYVSEPSADQASQRTDLWTAVSG